MSPASRMNACVFFAILASGVVGCSAYKPIPDYGDAEFMRTPPRTLAVMPVIDARKDKTAANIDIKGEAADPLLAKIRERGFTVTMAPAFASAAPQEVAELNDAELGKLVPTGSGATMFIFVDDATSTYVVMAKTSKVDMHAVIVDSVGRPLWKKRATASEGQGGLISGLMPTESAAFDDCTSALARDLPSPVPRK